MFLIKIEGLYGSDNLNAYYRKDGDCFNFCAYKNRATVFTNQDEILKILDHSDWYCKQFGAKTLSIVPLRG